MSKQILCSGSLAYDRLMSYAGVFGDHILPEQLHILNVCFIIDKQSLRPGGTGGNIAYNLHLMNETPVLIASLGDDPDGLNYMKRLESWGLSREGVKVHEGAMSAGCTFATDQKNSQLIFFHPGAMLLPSGFDPASLPAPYDQYLAIVSPGGFEEMKNLCRRYRELGLPFIYDPGQQIPVFSGPELLDMVNGSKVLICNEYELEMFLKRTGKSQEELFQFTEAIIVTKGDKGSDLIVQGRGSQHITVVPPRLVADPTGAGDAYRAGLLKALAHGEALITACRLGSAAAAFCVEADGPQDQKFTLGELLARHQSVFREALSLS